MKKLFSVLFSAGVALAIFFIGNDALCQTHLPMLDQNSADGTIRLLTPVPDPSTGPDYKKHFWFNKAVKFRADFEYLLYHYGYKRGGLHHIDYFLSYFPKGSSQPVAVSTRQGLFPPVPNSQTGKIPTLDVSVEGSFPAERYEYSLRVDFYEEINWSMEEDIPPRIMHTIRGDIYIDTERPSTPVLEEISSIAERGNYLTFKWRPSEDRLSGVWRYFYIFSSEPMRSGGLIARLNKAQVNVWYNDSVLHKDPYTEKINTSAKVFVPHQLGPIEMLTMPLFGEESIAGEYPYTFKENLSNIRTFIGETYYLNVVAVDFAGNISEVNTVPVRVR